MSVQDLLHDINEDKKRAAVLAALKNAADERKLTIVALVHGMRREKLWRCVMDNSLGTLTQSEVDWLAIDLQE